MEFVCKMNLTYLGQQAWILEHMPFDESYKLYKKRGEWNSIAQLLKNKKYTIAFTANKWQRNAREHLEKIGFEKILSFNSSHLPSVYHRGIETLTLWLKCNEAATISLAEKIGAEKIGTFYGNCSISASRTSNCKCVFTVKKPTEKLPAAFKRIRKTPFWVKCKKIKLI